MGKIGILIAMLLILFWIIYLSFDQLTFSAKHYSKITGP